MARYIKGKDGKFQGSIGDGKTKVPTSPRFGPYHPDYKTNMEMPQPPVINASSTAKEIADKLSIELDELYVFSTQSQENHDAAMANMANRAEVAKAMGHTQQHIMWTRISDIINRSHKENWKPETTYLYVHWVQGEMARFVDMDLRKNQ